MSVSCSNLYHKGDLTVFAVGRGDVASKMSKQFIDWDVNAIYIRQFKNYLGVLKIYLLYCETN